MKKKDEMVLALVKEIQMRKSEFKDEVVETIYFGGGTPSRLQIADLRSTQCEVGARFCGPDEPAFSAAFLRQSSICNLQSAIVRRPSLHRVQSDLVAFRVQEEGEEAVLADVRLGHENLAAYLRPG